MCDIYQFKPDTPAAGMTLLQECHGGSFVRRFKNMVFIFKNSQIALIRRSV